MLERVRVEERDTTELRICKFIQTRKWDTNGVCIIITGTHAASPLLPIGAQIHSDHLVSHAARAPYRGCARGSSARGIRCQRLPCSTAVSRSWYAQAPFSPARFSLVWLHVPLHHNISSSLNEHCFSAKCCSLTHSLTHPSRNKPCWTRIDSQTEGGPAHGGREVMLRVSLPRWCQTREKTKQAVVVPCWWLMVMGVRRRLLCRERHPSRENRQV